MNGLTSRILALSIQFQTQHKDNANLLFEVLILAEDRRARWHFGVDMISLVRALALTFRNRRFAGISTIEQQLVRTLIPRTRSPWLSKPGEMIYSVWIFLRFPKKAIWGAYLMAAYLGAEWSTLEEALEDIAADPSVLTLEDACVVVAHLKYPAPESSWPEGIAAHARRTRHLAARYRRKHPPLKRGWLKNTGHGLANT